MTEGPIVAVRAAFLLPTAIIILLASVPALSHRFLAYGSRLTRTCVSKDDARDERTQVPSTLVSKVLDILASIRVPHNYFAHFYVLSVALSLFWAFQISTHGLAFELVAKRFSQNSPSAMTVSEARLLWTMMLLQGSRRLYEETALKGSRRHSSSSKMFVGHWIMGLMFYATMSIAVWIEAVPALRLTEPVTLSSVLSMQQSLTKKDVASGLDAIAPSSIMKYVFGPSHEFWFPPPSLRLLGSMSLFAIASGAQYDVHSYFADLSNKRFAKANRQDQQYSMPSHPAFSQLGVVCPHYFFECLIYLAFAIVVIPNGCLVFHPTMACALIFTTINLGVTANSTMEWWRKQWGDESVKHKSRLIPFLW